MTTCAATRGWLYRNRLTAAAALLLVAHGLLATGLWSMLRDCAAFLDASWVERRTAYAFHAVPLDVIADQLDERLSGDARVELGPELLEDMLLRQRFIEGLYPRHVVPSAPNQLELTTSSVPGDEVLVEFADGVKIVLRSRWERATVPVQRPPPTPVIAALAGVATALSMGAFIWMRSRARRAADVSLALAVLGPAILFAVGAHLTAWSSVSLPRRSWLAVGAAAGIATLALIRQRPALLSRVRWRGWRLEITALAAMSALLSVRAFVLPVNGWDGRSVWFFRGHQLFEHGGLSRSEVLDPFLGWAHLGYPLLVPAWLWSFAAASPGFDERPANLGLALLFTACVGLVMRVGRAPLGRLGAAGLATSLWLSFASFTATGFVDGLLACLLVVEALAFVRRRTWVIGFTAAFAASLLKNEGFVLAIAIAALAVLTGRRGGSRSWPFGFLVFVPMTVHVLWRRALQLPDAYAGIRWLEVLQQLGPRTVTVGRGLLEALPSFPVLIQAAVAAVALCGDAAVRRRLPSRQVTVTFAMALAAFGIVTAPLVLTPWEQQWHLKTAFHRVLAQPAGLVMVAALLFLRQTDRQRARLVAPRPAQ